MVRITTRIPLFDILRSDPDSIQFAQDHGPRWSTSSVPGTRNVLDFARRHHTIIGKAHGGRGPKRIWEMPEDENSLFPSLSGPFPSLLVIGE